MDHSDLDAHQLANLAWAAGWLVALVLLCVLALRVPLQASGGRLRRWLLGAGMPVAIVAVAVLANVALTLHDVHFDATIEKTHTLDDKALAVVTTIDRPVQLTYLYQGQDGAAQRTREMVELMGRRNPLLSVQTLDPDKKPALAARFGIRQPNVAVLEAEGRRIVVPTVDEREIAIGIQRVLRQQVVAVCFVEGHNEYPVDNFEFHTHLESAHDHSHGDASSKLIETTGHGIGRLRRALESIGYEVRRITPATQGFPQSCSTVIDASPRNTWLPAEGLALAGYLEQGGSALLLFDLGFTLEPRLAAVLDRLGIALEPSVIVDPREHYGTDPEMVAVTGYDPHPVTRSVSLTFFPGARPLALHAPAPGVKTVALASTGRESSTRPVAPTQAGGPSAATAPSTGGAAGPRVIAAASEGRLGSADMRVVVVGDADFASNSFLPYMANGDLALSTVRWLVREEKSTPIAARIAAPPLVLLTKQQMQTIFVVVGLLLPLGVLALGGWVWWRRR